MTAVIDPTAADQTTVVPEVAPTPIRSDVNVPPPDSPELAKAKECIAAFKDFGDIFDDEEPARAYNALKPGDAERWTKFAKQKFGRDNFKVRVWTKQCDAVAAKDRQLAGEAAVEEEIADGGLPIVIFESHMQLNDKVQLALDAVKANTEYGDALYTQEGKLVRVRTSDDGILANIDPVTEAKMEEMITQSCRLYVQKPKQGKGGDIETTRMPVSPPQDVVRNAVNKDKYPFNILKGIRKSPLLFTDGEMVQIPGYDPRTCFIYKPHDHPMPLVADTVTQDDALASRQWIHDNIFEGFEFDTQASYANAFALLMTPAVRPFCGLAPFAVIEAPIQGSGKSLLAEAVYRIYTGQDPEGYGAATITTEEETVKTLLGVVSKGREFLFFDDVTGTFGNSELSRFTSSPYYNNRGLHKNGDLGGPNLTTPMVTMNGALLTDDMVRRAYRIRIKTKDPKPKDRNPGMFRHPGLNPWISGTYKENGVMFFDQPVRGQILHHIYTIARAWILSGRPMPEKMRHMATFDSWCETLAGILHFVGVNGFLGNQNALEDDMAPETGEWIAFLTAWANNYGYDMPIRTADVVKAINNGKYNPDEEKPSAVTNPKAKFKTDMVPSCLYGGKSDLSAGHVTSMLKKKVDHKFGAEQLYLTMGTDKFDHVKVFTLHCGNPGYLDDFFISRKLGEEPEPEAKPRPEPEMTDPHCVICGARTSDNVKLTYTWGPSAGVMLCTQCAETKVSHMNVLGAPVDAVSRWDIAEGFEGYIASSAVASIEAHRTDGVRHLLTDAHRRFGHIDMNYKYDDLAALSDDDHMLAAGVWRNCVACGQRATREAWRYTGAYVCDDCMQAVSYDAEKPRGGCKCCANRGMKWHDAPLINQGAELRYDGWVHGCIVYAITQAIRASTGKTTRYHVANMPF